MPVAGSCARGTAFVTDSERMSSSYFLQLELNDRRGWGPIHWMCSRSIAGYSRSTYSGTARAILSLNIKGLLCISRISVMLAAGELVVGCSAVPVALDRVVAIVNRGGLPRTN